jgi:hypothetical protein
MTDKPFIYPRGSVGNIEPKAGDASIIGDLDSAEAFAMPQVNWSDAFDLLSEEDRVKAHGDYLDFGQAVIFMNDDGTARYVPLKDYYTEVEGS